MFESVKAFHADADRLIARVREESERAGRPVVCRRGCWHCCYEPLYGMMEEAELAVASADAQGRREWVIEGVKEALEILGGSRILSSEEPPVIAYRSLQVRCPFLNEGECLIYKDRPYGCRSHLAIGHARNCRKNSKRLGQMYAISEALKAFPAEYILGRESATMDHFILLLADVLGLKRPESASGMKLVIDRA